MPPRPSSRSSRYCAPSACARESRLVTGAIIPGKSNGRPDCVEEPGRRGSRKASGVSRRRSQPADEEIGEQIRDRLRARRAVRAVPPRDPVHRAEQREREQLRIAVRRRRPRHAFLDDAAHALVERVAPRDHRLEVRGGQRFEIEKQRRAVQLVEDRVDEGVDQAPQLGVGGRRRCASISSSSCVSRSSEYWWQAKRISSLFLK